LYLDDSSDRAPNYLRADYSGRTHYVELYGNKKWKYIELLAGVDYRQNNMSIDVLSVSQFGPYSSSLPDSIAKMWQASPYASVIVKPNRIFNIELGGRLNNHSEYGNNFSYTVNPSLFINNELKLFVNLYSAFKAPTLFELYDPLFGNRNLDPEESINIETGAQWFITNSFSVRAVYFYRDTKNSIEFIYTDPANYISQYRNIASKKAHGIEVEAAYKGDKWNFAGNYTHIEGTLRSAYDNAGFPLDKEIVVDNLFRTPKDVFNLNAGIWLTKKLYTGTSVRIAGKRLEPVYASEPKELDSYYTLDLYGEYRIRKGIKAFADFKNITDQQYFEIAGYNTRGFNLMGGLQVSL
jgi:vitamin B12 transporter